MYEQHADLSSIRYLPANLSNFGTIFTAANLWVPKISPKNPIYNSLFQPFDTEYFLYPRLPIDMGRVKFAFSDIPNVLRLPIKNQGKTYFIPQELTSLLPLLERIANYESSINPDVDKYFCHITYDHSNVPAGQCHRFPGFHGDGFQGTKLTPKLFPEHSYIVVTNPGTEVCLQPFFLKHLDEAKHNEFLEMDQQAREENIYSLLSDHLYLFDPYIVHRTPQLKMDTERYFLRVTYTSSELEHPKNTINPMMKPYSYEDRVEVRETLSQYDQPLPYYLYGLNYNLEIK